jgi:actin-related protein
MALVLDSAVPLPLLSAILDAAFERFQAPMISLLSSATMSAVAAGVRSALVINMGWTETTVTSVYEYREVKASQTVRGGRYLLNKLYRKLIRRLIDGTFDNDAKKTDKKRDDETEESDGSDEERLISFDEMEDLMCRLMWCRPSASRSSQRHSAQLETVEEQDESEAEIAATPTPQAGATQVPLTSTNPPMIIDVQFEKIADICDDTFFDPSASPANFDDNELPVHMLVYRHLLQLPIDVRAICMSRIIFTGGCSNILGIKERILDEVTSTVERRGWEPVSGKGVDQLHTNPKLQRRGPSRSPNEATSPGSETEDGQSDVSGGVANADHDVDPIEAKVSRHRNVPQPTQGQIRALHSLGPWTGGSLLCQIKVLAVATIDRELWLQQGAHGASRPNEVDVRAQHRQSLGAGGLIRGSGGHHANWTLGTWGSV